MMEMRQEEIGTDYNLCERDWYIYYN